MFNIIIVLAILYLFVKQRVLNACLKENNIEIHEINKIIDGINVNSNEISG